MLIEDLPRLTDEEREALDDGYVAMEGVSAPDPAPQPSHPTGPQWALALIGIALVIAVVIYGVTARLEPWEREESRNDE